MADNSKLEALRQAVLGSDRGREATVTSDGKVLLNPSDSQDKSNQPGDEEHAPKTPKMSPHTFGA